MDLHHKTGPISISVHLTRYAGMVSVGNRHRTGTKIGVAWRLPYLCAGTYVSSSSSGGIRGGHHVTIGTASD